MTDTAEKRHTCPLCNGEGVLPPGRIPVEIKDGRAYVANARREHLALRDAAKEAD